MEEISEFRERFLEVLELIADGTLSWSINARSHMLPLPLSCSISGMSRITQEMPSFAVCSVVVNLER